MEALAVAPAPVAESATDNASNSAAIPESKAEESNVVELKGGVDESGAEPAKSKPEPKKYKLTIDGQHIEATDEDINGWMRAAKEGTTVKEQKQLMEEQVRMFIERGRNEPEYLFEQLGVNSDLIDDFVEKRVMQKLQDAQMSPEQREARELKARLAKYEEQEKKIKEAEKLKEAKALEEEAKKTIDDLITNVISSTGKKPTLTRMARVGEWLYAHLQSDPDAVLTPELVEKAYKLAEKNLRHEVSQLSNDLSPEELIDILGEANLNKLLKHDLQKAKKNVPDFAPKGLGTNQGQKSKPNRPLTFDEAFALKLKELS